MKFAKIALVVVCTIAVACVGRVFADQNANVEGSLEDQQVAAKAKTMVVQAKGMGKTLTSDTKGESISDQGRLLVMREWLKDIPQKERSEFLGELILNHGQVVSASYGSIGRVATEARQAAILDSFAPSRGGAKSTSDVGSQAPPRLISLSELLRDVPADAKDAFLNGMVFNNGVIVSVDTSEIAQVVSSAKLKEILDSLGPANGKTPKPGTKALCGSGWCDHSVCTNTNQEPLHCEYRDNRRKICYDTCSN
ncbi:MAG: hypothetical protein HY748_04855 [Elusimicrobia bacterium]|nr:hypothetical protein [Elusimicrobiota bacterium]